MVTPAPMVGVVVVNWNGRQLTLRCLRSILSLEYPNLRVCVVDGASSDGSVEAIRASLPTVKVLSLSENRGFAAACNAGLAWARQTGAHYAFLLNNDVTLDRSCLTALVESSRRHGDSVLLTPKVLASNTGTIWAAGGLLRWPWLERQHRGAGRKAHELTEETEVPWASGCALFLSLEAAERIGPLDERYFLYLEDVEWCLRARRKGVPVRYVPDAVVWHDISATTEAVDPRIVRYYVVRNYYLLVFTHGGVVGRLWAAARLLLTLAKTGLRTVFTPSSRGDGYYHAQTRAILDFLRGRLGMAPYPHELLRPQSAVEAR
jgi:GT2 family glycosyltransferase